MGRSLLEWLPKRFRAVPFRRVLYGALAVVVLLIWLAGGVQLWLERSSYLSLAATASENLSLALAEYTEQTLQGIDNRLSDIVAQEPQWSSPARRGAAHLYLKDLADRDNTIRSIRIFDAAGQIEVSSDDVAEDFPRISEREDFVAHRSGTAKPLHVGLPQRVPNGEWRYPLSRRLVGPRGEFAGIAVANLDSDTFEKFFATLDVGSDGLVTLLRTDSVLLIRRPRLDSAVGRLPFQAIIPDLATRSTHGQFTFTSKLDGVVRIGYFRRLADYPLIVSVSISMDHALAPWRHLVTQFLVILLGMSVAVFLLGWAVTRQHARWEAAEAAVRDRMQQLEGIAINMPAVVFQRVRTAEGRSFYTYVDPKIRDVFGVEPLQVTQNVLALQAITHPDDMVRIQKTYEQSAVTMTLWRQEFRIERAGKGLAWIRGAATPRRGAGGEVIWDGVYMDITAEKLAQEHLQRAHRMETVGQLASGVAHQFNNLLMSIMGHLELIELETAKDHPAAHSARTALEAVQRGATLTRQLLAFSRRQRLEPNVFEVNRGLQEIGELLTVLLDKTIGVTLDLREQLPGVHVDRGEFQASVLALVLNAKDAMPKGGTLRISSALEELGQEEARKAFVPPGRYVVVAVRDTGIGMSEAVQLRAFEPFFTTKGAAQGAGMGLSQVHGFMQQIRGHITLQSSPESGTAVALYFPISDAAQQDAPPGELQDAAPGRAAPGSRLA